MANIGSKQKGGAYPISEEWATFLWRLWKPFDTSKGARSLILDPFANEAQALVQGARTLSLEPYGIELQDQFIAGARENMAKLYRERNMPDVSLTRLLHDDSFEVEMSNGGFGIVYCNSPFDDLLLTDSNNHKIEMYDAQGRWNPNSGKQRYELTSLQHFTKYVAPYGYMVWVAYSQHMTRKVAQHFMNKYDGLVVFRFPEAHLDHYTQIVVIANYIKGHEKIKDPEARKEKENWFVDLGQHPEKIPNIETMYNALEKSGKYLFPNRIKDVDFPPIPKLNIYQGRVHFVGDRIDDEARLKMNLLHGAHTLPKFARLCEPSKDRPLEQPLHRPNKRQLVINIASGMLDNLPLMRNGKRALLRGSTREHFQLISKEEEEIERDDETITRITETTMILPAQHIALLYEDGMVEDLSKADDLSEVIEENATLLIDTFAARFNPFYDMVIDPVWVKLLKQVKMLGKHKLFKPQKYVVTCTIEHLAIKGKQITNAQQGFGKAQPLDAKILTPAGWKMMGDIQVGDMVMGSNGKPTKVLGVFPQGHKPIYRLTMSDGTSTEASDEHLWTVQDQQGSRHWKTLTTNELIDKGVKTAQGHDRWVLPTLSEMQFECRDLPVDPYLLGLLIGDGCLKDHSVSISTADQEIVDAVAAVLPEELTMKQQAGNSGYDYAITSSRGVHFNPLLASIQNMGLAGARSWEKHIPDVYKFASVPQRLALLQGLLDSDGSAMFHQAEYTTVSPSLARDVRDIVLSLGGRCHTVERFTTYTYEGEKKRGMLSYRLAIKLPDGMPMFRLERKQSLIQSRSKYSRVVRSIERIEYMGEEPAQCILVEAEDHLYITDDYIPTHNTGITGATAIGLRLVNEALLVHDASLVGMDIPVPPMAARYGITNDELRALVQNMCSRYKVKREDISGLGVKEPMIVAVPAIAPSVWLEQELPPMFSGFKTAQIFSPTDADKFMAEATANQNSSEIYVGVISYENAKANEGRDPVAVPKYKRGFHNERGEWGALKRVMDVTKVPCDPITGQPILDSDGEEVPWKYFTNEGRRTQPIDFYVGPEFYGYATKVVELPDGKKEVVTDFEKKRYTRIVARRLDKDEQDRNRAAGYPVIATRYYPMYSEVRKFGKPKIGNGRSDTPMREVHHPEKIIKQIMFHDDSGYKVKQPYLKEVKVQAWTMLVPDFERQKNLVPGEPIIDPWLAWKGIRYTQAGSKRKDIDAALKKARVTHYRVGGGKPILDAILKKHGLSQYTVGVGEVGAKNPKYPVANYLRRFYNGKIGFFVADEIHTAKNNTSEVASAFRDLAMASKKVNGLTGTLYGGKSSSVYALAYAFDDEIREQYPWVRGTPMKWVEDMGVRKMVEVRDVGGRSAIRSGKRQAPRITEANGAAPLLQRVLAKYTLWASLLDLRGRMPEKHEISYAVPFDKDMERLYNGVFNILKKYNADCIVKGDRSFLAPYYTNMLYLSDAMHRRGEVIHNIKMDKGAARKKAAEPVPYIVCEIPALGDNIRPKEQMAMDWLKEDLAAGRKVIIAMCQTSSRDIRDRWMDIIRANVPEAKPFMLKDTVKASGRSAYIKKMINDGHNVMITNGGLIQVAISITNMSAWYSIEYTSSLYNFAQSTARINRPSQESDSIVYRHFYYEDDKFQRDAIENIADKVKAAAVLAGAEGGDLAAMMSSEDRVASYDGLLKAIESGQQKRKTAAEIADAFAAANYTSANWSDSAWFLPGDELELDDGDFYEEVDVVPDVESEADMEEMII